MNHIEMLYECAYKRGVGNLQHRTINEFSAFIENVIWSGEPEYEQYKFDFNQSNAIEIWIEKFYEYRKVQSKIEQQAIDEEIGIIKV